MNTALFPDHPERETLQAEAHARPPLAITMEDAEVWHWVLMNVDPQVEWIGSLEGMTRHRVMQVADGVIRVERHTEFISITFLGQAGPNSETRKLLAQCKGQLLTGQRIVLRRGDAPDVIARLFHKNRQFGGRLVDPDVRIRSDFVAGPDSMVDYVVEGRFHDAEQRGQIIKWLIDLETYRVASLLALPLVRRLDAQLQSLDSKAAEVVSALSKQDYEEDGGVVDELAELLSATGQLRERLRFRIAASMAYYELVRDRLVMLRQKPEGGLLTLEGFVEHRLTPGIKTVLAFERRLNDLSVMVSAAMDLARTRIDHRLQLQNQKLLASMERRAHQQVHLAQAVEGLSVAAITYYVVSLLAKALESLPPLGVSDKLLVGAAIPVVALAVWFAAQKARKAISRL